jgi:hypothetical protein
MTDGSDQGSWLADIALPEDAVSWLQRRESVERPLLVRHAVGSEAQLHWPGRVVVPLDVESLVYPGEQLLGGRRYKTRSQADIFVARTPDAAVTHSHHVLHRHRWTQTRQIPAGAVHGFPKVTTRPNILAGVFYSYLSHHFLINSNKRAGRGVYIQRVDNRAQNPPLPPPKARQLHPPR